MQKRYDFIFWLAAPPIATIYAIAFVLFKLCGLPGLCSTTWHLDVRKKVSVVFTAIKNHIHPFIEVAYGQRKIFSK